jgi:hypothetical protein
MALLSPDSSSAPQQSASSSSPRTGLAPLVTAPKHPAQSARNNRISAFSLQSNASNHAFNAISRPASMAFPQFHSSLPYALVRDFAYPPFHPLHYGPQPPGMSGSSTPASDVQQRRVSDPAPSYDATRGDWQNKAWDTDPLPKTAYAERDGPPWSEDEDLASPVVTTSRHKKNKSSIPAFDDIRAHASTNGRTGTGYDYSKYEQDVRKSQLILQNRTYQEEPPLSDEFSEDDEERRFSRDYQFTIVSPDEEMHGRAVALFDFDAENENELSMKEGMIVFISFRHGEGWLVAQDLKSDESGLVPESYVRLLREIEGGYDGLLGANGENDEARTPTQESASLSQDSQDPSHDSNYQPVVSTFSISREDLEPFPKEKLNSPSVATPTEQNKKSLDEAIERAEREAGPKTPKPTT